jgi:GNAT superfamily N-acetyltransferase
MDPLNVVPLEPDHLQAAASLLAERQRRIRTPRPDFPAAFEDPSACRPLIEEALSEPGAVGVVALAAGEPAGFMIMSPIVFSAIDIRAAFLPARPAEIPYVGHAARPDVAYDAYREMYGVLSGEFVARGYFDHIAYVSPSEQQVHDAFGSLSFGRTLVAAMRGVDPVSGADGTRVEVHRAGIEDIAVVTGLNDELLLHHARAPIFWPHLEEPRPALDGFQRTLLDEPDENAHLVAYDGGRAVGMNTFMAPVWINPLVRPDRTIYLYQGIVSENARSGGVGKAILARGVEWAREQGYEHVALHYASPNLSGARFWQSQGFEAIEYRMARRVDERIAWAGADANGA